MPHTHAHARAGLRRDWRRTHQDGRKERGEGGGTTCRAAGIITFLERTAIKELLRVTFVHVCIHVCVTQWAAGEEEEGGEGKGGGARGWGRDFSLL